MKNFKKLTRDEMKQILGGVEAPPSCGYECTSDSKCTKGCPSCLNFNGSKQCSSAQ